MAGCGRQVGAGRSWEAEGGAREGGQGSAHSTSPAWLRPAPAPLPGRLPLNPRPLPAGDWFCSEECTAINQLLATYVQAGQMEIPGSPGHTWQVSGWADRQPGGEQWVLPEDKGQSRFLSFGLPAGSRARQSREAGWCRRAAIAGAARLLQ